MILQLAPETMPKFVILIEDFVVTAQSLQRDKLVQSLREQKLTLSSYLLLYQPALEWVIDCYGRLTGAAGMDQLLTLAESSQFSGLVLNCVMTSFKADLVAHRPMQICALIHSSNDEVFPSYILCRTLGKEVDVVYAHGFTVHLPTSRATFFRCFFLQISWQKKTPKI